MSGQDNAISERIQSIEDCPYFQENRGDDSRIFQVQGVLCCAKSNCSYQVGPVVAVEYDSSLARQCGISGTSKTLAQVSDENELPRFRAIPVSKRELECMRDGLLELKDIEVARQSA